MSFRQYLSAEIAKGLDETYRAESWEKDFPGKAYYGVHLSVIEERETATPTLAEFLGSGGMRVLESGCGTGRWMAYLAKLGNRTFGLDDSAGPLRVARAHDPDMNLVRADALNAPFKTDAFDAAVSWYVAEHFPQGPEPLFRQIHRVLRPGGVLFVAVPFNNAFRRAVVNPALRFLGWVWVLRGKRLGFTEFRYSKHEMDEFLTRANFEIIRVLPDDFRPPWAKGLSVDLCDVSSFFNRAPKKFYELKGSGTSVVRALRRAASWYSCGGILRSPKRLYEFGRLGTFVARMLRGLGPWYCCSGIFYVVRARK